MTNTITMPRSVVEQTIEAMRRSGEQRGSTATEFNAIEALRAALEQPQGEQEPYGYVYGNSFWEAKNPRITDDVRRLGKPLYTRPHPPRQPLTDAQINDHRLALPYDGEDLPDPWDFKQGVRAAERAHRIGGEA